MHGQQDIKINHLSRYLESWHEFYSRKMKSWKAAQFISKRWRVCEGFCREFKDSTLSRFLRMFNPPLWKTSTSPTAYERSFWGTNLSASLQVYQLHQSSMDVPAYSQRTYHDTTFDIKIYIDRRPPSILFFYCLT